MINVIGILAILIGVVLLAPFTRTHFRDYKDRMNRRMPWMERLPGARTLYGDSSQGIVLRVVALGFVIFGLLLLLRIVEYRG